MKKTIIKDWIIVKSLCLFFTVVFSFGILIYCLVRKVNLLGYFTIFLPVGLFGAIYILSLIVVKKRKKDIIQLNNKIITGFESGEFFEYKWSDVDEISVHKYIYDDSVSSILLEIIGIFIRPFYATVTLQIKLENEIKQIKFDMSKRAAKKLQAMVNR